MTYFSRYATVHMDMQTDPISARALHSGITWVRARSMLLGWLTAACTALIVIACALLATAFLLVPRPAHATNGQCIWEGGPGASQYSECNLEDCQSVGGKAQCTDPVIRPPNGLTDAQVDGQKFEYITYSQSEYENIDWCLAAGGTYNGFNAPYQGLLECAGLDTNTYPGSNPYINNSDNGATTITAAAVALRYSNCDVSLAADTGWTSSTFPQVGGTYPYIRNGKDLTDAREQVFTLGGNCNSSATIGYLRLRQLVCPVSFTARTLANGDLGCFIPAEGCCTTGDPVSPVTGAVMQSAMDYQSPISGGLELGHYYNSQSRWRAPGSGPFIAANNDYWRFSYSRHLTPVSGNTQLTAWIQREDGHLETFDGSGREILNTTTGAADRLTGSAASGWTLTRGNTDVETYSPAGNLTSITNRSGLSITLSYDPSGNLSQAIDSFGHKLTFNFNPQGQLGSVVLPDGSSTITYGYGSLGQLTSVTYPDQTTITYQYGSPVDAFLLTGITDETGQTYITYTYNSSGAVTGQQLAGGVGAYSFNFGGISYQTEIASSVTDPLGATHQYVLDNQNGVFKTRYTTQYCDSCPNVSNESYDANGNLQSRTDLDGKQTTYTYDQTRNLELSRTEGLSGGSATSATRTITTQWHPTFRLPTQVSVYAGASATGAPLRTTSHTYDGYGNVLTTTVTDGATGTSRTFTSTYYNSGLYGQLQTYDGPRTDVNDVTTNTYYACATGAQCGQLQTVTDALGRTTTYTSYDANGLPLSMTDPNGLVTTWTYDLRQRLKTVTIGTEQSRFDYYANGLVQKMTQADGSYLLYIYDAARRLVETDDAAGDRLLYTLDAAGNIQRVSTYDPVGTLALTQTQIYNTLGQLWQQLTSSQSSSQAIVYSYDAQGNQVNVAAPLGHMQGFAYDTLNRVMQLTDPAGTTAFTYDANDNVTAVTDPRGLATNYTYNGFGDLKQLQSPETGTTQYSPDSAGNVATRSNALGTASYTYDALNRPTSVTYPDQTVSLTYDQGANALGRLTGITDSSGQTTYAYDSQGRVSQKRQVTGNVTLTVGYTHQNSQLASMTLPSGNVLTYGYDSAGRVVSITANTNTLITGVTYGPFGPLTAWTWGNGAQTTRSYDVDGHLTAISSAGQSTYTFADDGLISSRSDDTENDYSVVAGTTLQTVSTTSNRLTGSSGPLSLTYSYDGMGNVTGNGAGTFTYDKAGRLRSYTQSNSGTSFSINGLGQRVAKTSSAGTVLFAYDESSHLIGEYTGGGALIEETVWLGDTPVAILRPNAAGVTDIYYVHTDHLNTPRRITRASDNVIVWRWNSDAYGVGFVDQDPDGDGQLFIYNFRFPGQYFDVETGLHYNYHRDFDPASGRYIESDPIGLNGGVNSYAYANGNPVSNSDPSGLFSYPEHVSITKKALAGYTSFPGLPQDVAKVDFLSGSQLPLNSFWHAMSDGTTNQPAWLARELYNYYVETQILTCTIAGLAKALHAVQDSDALGHQNFASWNGGHTPLHIPSFAHIRQDWAPRGPEKAAAIGDSKAVLRRYHDTCECSPH